MSRFVSVLEDSDLNYIFSDENIYCDYDKFKSKEIQCLFITGMSGGGKTYLSKKLQKENNCELIELDHYTENKYAKEYFDANPKAYNELLDALNAPRSKFYYATRMSLLKECLIWIKDKHKDKQFIFEGVQIPIIFRMELAANKFNLFKEGKYAIILISTSFTKSFFRRLLRDNVNLFKFSSPSRLLHQYIDWFDSQNNLRRDIFKQKGFEWID